MSSPQQEDAGSGGILEQAWMMKMAQEIARKVQEEKDRADNRQSRKVGKESGSRGRGIWAEEEVEREAPPAYVA
jgi:distribution and morphology protein 34